jgi:hypothetical protein
MMERKRARRGCFGLSLGWAVAFSSVPAGAADSAPPAAAQGAAVAAAEAVTLPHVVAALPDPPALQRPAPRLGSPWPELAAVFPGVLVHGSGVWLQRRNQTAQRLLLLEGAGVLTTLLAGFVLFQTGAARDVVGPTALVAVGGVGTFGLSLLSNLYATWAPPEGFGVAQGRVPLLETRVGYLYVHDPVFDFSHFLTTRLDGRVGPWHVALGTAHAPEQDNQRFELGAGYRWFGNGGAVPSSASDGSYLEGVLGYSAHHFDGSGFLSRVVEVKLEGRLDVHRYLPDVRGAFFQLEAGYAGQWLVFDLPGVATTTATSLLLAHVGFGVYVGNRAPSAAGPTGGEIELYYDHRHDGFAGGLKMPGLGSGPAGHLGLLGSYQFSPRWGVRAQSEVGSAWTLGLGLVMRVGTR